MIAAAKFVLDSGKLLLAPVNW